MMEWKKFEVKTRSIWLLSLLPAILMGVLFPFGWLEGNWPLFGRLAGRLFASESAHVAGHLLLFSLVGGVLLHAFPRLLDRPRSYLALMCMLGMGQEFFQLVSFKHHGPGPNEFFDLAIDLLAAGLAYGIYQTHLIRYPAALHNESQQASNTGNI